jgi:hypothetical protein
MFNGTGTFHCLSGVEVSESSFLPAQFSRVQIPAQRYVIFAHREHVSKLHGQYDLVSVVSGIGLQSRSHGRWCSGFLLNDTARALIRSSEWAMSKSGFR